MGKPLKIEDCKVGMKVRCIDVYYMIGNEKSGEFEIPIRKGREYIIKEVTNQFISIDDKTVIDAWYPERFEAVTGFEGREGAWIEIKKPESIEVEFSNETRLPEPTGVRSLRSHRKKIERLKALQAERIMFRVAKREYHCKVCGSTTGCMHPRSKLVLDE